MAANSVSPSLSDPMPRGIVQGLIDPSQPWKFSPALMAQIRQQLDAGSPYAKVPLTESHPEYQFASQYFHHNPPPGVKIKAIYAIYNRALNRAFEAGLEIMEEENFPANWRKEAESQWREKAHERWERLVNPLKPVTVGDGVDRKELKRVNVLPLVHGTAHADSIFRSGFTYFGKHHFFRDNQSAPGPLASTDRGYFGSGIYFTDSFRYAGMYNPRQLIISFVSTREPYPVISDRPHPNKCTDMQRLGGHGAYQTYNSHFIPVASTRPEVPIWMEYYPCYQDQLPSWDEFVVFQKYQALPGYLIETEVPIPDNIGACTIDDCFQAAKMGSIAYFRDWLLAHREKLDHQDANGATLLHHLAVSGNFEDFNWLVHQKSSLFNTKMKAGWTPMQIAALSDHIEILETYPEEAKKANEESFLFELVKTSSSSALRFFVEREKLWAIDLKMIDRNRQTLLHHAAQAGQGAQVAILLDHRAEIDIRDRQLRTPLYLATTHGHRDVVRLLMDRGADPKIPSIEGDTALHIAAFYGHTLVLRDLSRRAPQLLSARDDDGKTPLHKSVWHQESADCVKMLLDLGQDPNVGNNWQYTALHWAAKHGHLVSAALLLQRGANSNKKNANGDTPLDLAVKFEQPALAALLRNPSQAEDIVRAHPFANLIQENERS